MIWDLPSLFLPHGTLNPACDWVVHGWSMPTRMVNGKLCLFQGGHLYKEYQASPDKAFPPSFFLSQEEPLRSGNYAGWVPISPSRKADLPYRNAFTNLVTLASQNHMTAAAGLADLAAKEGVRDIKDGLYICAGPGVSGNYDQFVDHVLLRCADLTFAALGMDLPRRLVPDAARSAALVQQAFVRYPDMYGICWWEDINDQTCRKAQVLHTEAKALGGTNGQ